VLGLRDRLVGRTHECDWPPGIESVPVMTANALTTDSMTSREIDRAVGAAAHSGSSIYTLDLEALREAKPDLIVTQELCEVCAVSYREVAKAARTIEGSPKIVSLEPRGIEDILEHVLLVGRLTGAEDAAGRVVQDARARVERLREITTLKAPIKVFCMEWTDPIYASGHWVPEQVDLAGGIEALGWRRGQPSRQVEWDEVVAAEPRAIFLMPCGVSLERVLVEIKTLSDLPGWHELPAVRSGRVWAVDGPSYFNRPGPRVIRGAEILAALLYPGVGVVEPNEAVQVPQSL
jgi:iron complex transport system substrate-binding protein